MQAQSQRKVFCFVHIERAGGTTLHHIIHNNSLAYLVVTPFLWPHEEGHVFRAEEARWLFKLAPFTRGFGGHSTRSYLGYEEAIGRPVQYLTFLRDPVKRYLSHFNHQVSSMGIKWTFDSFSRETRFDNFMTHRLAGGPNVAEAKRRLQQDFDFVGLTDRFDESLVLMRDVLGGPDFCVNYRRENSSRNQDYKELKLTPSVLARARENNQLDQEVYDFAVQLFEQRCREYGGEFQAEVAELKNQNLSFEFRRETQLMAGAMRWLVYKPVEATLRRVYHPEEPMLPSLRQRANSFTRRLGFRP